jgi:hypothetical protein
MHTLCQHTSVAPPGCLTPSRQAYAPPPPPHTALHCNRLNPVLTPAPQLPHTGLPQRCPPPLCGYCCLPLPLVAALLLLVLSVPALLSTTVLPQQLPPIPVLTRLCSLNCLWVWRWTCCRGEKKGSGTRGQQGKKQQGTVSTRDRGLGGHTIGAYHVLTGLSSLNCLLFGRWICFAGKHGHIERDTRGGNVISAHRTDAPVSAHSRGVLVHGTGQQQLPKQWHCLWVMR